MDKQGKIITIKVNKGGVGKTFFTTTLGHGLAQLEKKVLLLTSDSQNNILDITFKDGKRPIFNSGLKNWVTKGDGELIKIRENMYFIPLEDNHFSTHFLEKLRTFLKEIRKEYDYIFIDSIPTMDIDSVFVESSDKIIVPTFCDRSTIEGTLNVMEEEMEEKIFAIMINKYKNTETQKKYYDQLKEVLEDTDIVFTEPIPDRSIISKNIDSGKTIWESRSKQMIEIQEIFLDVLYELTGGIDE